MKSVQRWRRQLLLLKSTSFCTVRPTNLRTIPRTSFSYFFAAHNFLCIKTVCSHHTLNLYSKEIFYVLFNTYFFHPVPVFHNISHFSSSKFIIYINYHSYFIIFSTINLFSLIPTSTIIHYFILIYITIIFYFHSTVKIVNILYESFFIFSYFYSFFFFSFSFSFPSLFFFSFPPPSYLFMRPPPIRLFSSLSLVLFHSASGGGSSGRGRGLVWSVVGRWAGEWWQRGEAERRLGQAAAVGDGGAERGGEAHSGGTGSATAASSSAPAMAHRSSSSSASSSAPANSSSCDRLRCRRWCRDPFICSCLSRAALPPLRAKTTIVAS
jgi:hypothetical protein